MKHLFTFANAGGFEDKFQQSTSAFSQSVDFSAPVVCPPNAVPADYYNIKDVNSGLIQTIDVLNDFDWTLNSSSSRRNMGDIPYIRMSEYAIDWNSFLQNLKFLLNAAGDALDVTGIKENPVVQSALGKADTIATGVAGSDLVRAIVGEEGLDQAYKEMKDGIKDKLTIDHAGVPYYLRPYNGLYGVRPTGFKYIMPYFSADWKTVSSQWGDITGGGIFGGLANIGTNVAAAFVEGAAAFTTGAFFERPKSYNFNPAGEAITFKFPLFNTRDHEQVTKNFELVLLLTYQQLANKMSHVLLDPPVIYEVEIPGKYYTPYGYVSNLSIQTVGAQRNETINILSRFEDRTDSLVNQDSKSETVVNAAGTQLDPLADGTTGDNNVKARKGQPGRPRGIYYNSAADTSEISVNAIIPEIWEVTLTIQSLVPNTKNLYYHSLAGASGLYDTSIARSEAQFEQEVNRAVDELPPIENLDLDIYTGSTATEYRSA